MKNYSCIIFFVIQLFFIFSVQDINAQFQERSHSAFTRTMPYYLFTPKNYSAENIYPLVLILHGNGPGLYPENDIAKTWIEDTLQQKYPSFVVIPQSPYLSWRWNLDMVNSLLLSLIEKFSIDTTRLYITGFSMGGWGTSHMIIMSPIHFAAAFPMAGGAYNELLPLTSYIPPIWNFHSIEDSPEYSRNMIEALKNVTGIEPFYPYLKNGNPTGHTEAQLDSAIQAGANLIYTETTGDHMTSIRNAYKNPKVKEWMFSKTTEFSLPQVSSPIIKTRETEFVHVGSGPVLQTGNAGSWEAFAVSEPCVIIDSDTLKMWYVGWQSGWHQKASIGYAWSLDGINWNRHVHNPVMSASLPWEGVRINQVSVIKDNDIYRMWYSAGDNYGFSTAIGYAWSEDGLAWTKHADAVLLPGSLGEWDHFNIGVGTVIKEDDILKMWYHGGTYWTGMKIGYATSADGISWTKYNDPQTEDMPYHMSDPVVSVGRFAKDWDYHGAWYPMVYHDSKGYEMWYSGSTVSITGFLHYAVSEDGIAWSKSASNPLLSRPPPWSGDNEAVKTGYYGGSVVKDRGEYHFWYSQYYYDKDIFLIGYVKDLRKIARTDSFTISHCFRRATLDTLNVAAWINNSPADNLQVTAQFSSNDSLIDSLLLSNGTGNVWIGKWPVADGERTYSVSIKTTDLDSATVHESNRAMNKYFTTVGPLTLADYKITSADSIANPGDQLQIRFYIKNWGQVTTAENITAKITVLDTFASFTNDTELNFDNIAAGTTMESANLKTINFKEGHYPQNPYAVKFAAEIKSDGHLFWSDTFAVFVDTVLAITDNTADIPHRFALQQNYPNPFNPKTVISWQLAVSSHVDLSIYNIIGQKVATLVNRKQPAGSYSIEWDASKVSSGVYYYRLEAEGYSAVKKMILLR